MDRFKGNRFRKFINFLFIFIIILFLFSCSNYRKVKIEIVDMNNIKLDNFEISIIGYLTKKIEGKEDLILNLKKQEYVIRVLKDNYFPFEEIFNIKETNNILIKIKSIEDGINEINEKLSFELKNLDNFSVDFSGKINGIQIEFTSFFDFHNNLIKVNSKYLEKEMIINKIDSKYVYNDNNLPEDIQKYFDEILKIIKDSVIFVKDLPLEIENKSYKSANGYIIVEFESKNINLEITGYIILDGFNLSFKNQSISIKTIDEMKRESEINLNFYVN